MTPLDPHRDRATIRALFDHNAVFAYPTEAVFGLGGKPCAATFREIIRLKGRDSRKGVILVAADWQQARPLIADLPAAVWHNLQRWHNEPRATTFILPARANVEKCLCDAEHGNIAVRISRHPVVIALCRLTESPLISTSANLSGEPPAQSASAVANNFPRLPIIAGEIGNDPRPSRIIDPRSNQILRD